MVSVKESGRRTYGGRTADERFRERRTALVAATLGEVSARGWRELTIDGVCRRAGLNKRYFYESFADLAALTAALTDRLAEDAIAVALGAIDPDSPPDAAVRSAVGALVSHLTDDPRRARVLFGAVPAGDAAAGHRATAIRRVITTVAAQARRTYELGEDPAVELTAAMLVGGTSQAVLDWLDGRIATSREAFVDDLVALWQALGGAVAARVGPSLSAGRPT